MTRRSSSCPHKEHWHFAGEIRAPLGFANPHLPGALPFAHPQPITKSWVDPQSLLREGGSQGASEQWEQVLAFLITPSEGFSPDLQLPDSSKRQKIGGKKKSLFQKRPSRLTVQKTTENLHRQFTCLQGVNCSWHFTRRQHLPWNYHCFKSS